MSIFNDPFAYTSELWYVITEERGKLEALFFSSREKAEEWAEENYYICTGDVREVKIHEGT